MPKPKFYITTAIDYPNGPPHVGHAYEKIITDCIARWHKLRGERVFFLTGTDENSQKIQEAAQAAHTKPKAFLETTVPLFIELCKALNISIDGFIRTTAAKHKRIAQKLFEDAHKHGDIYKGEYEGLYCVGCEAFYTEKDLVDGKCPTHERPAEHYKEESYFFRLSKYQQKVKDLILQHPDFIQPESKRKEILNRLESDPLRDLSVSRHKRGWGIQVPFDKSHRIYVWYDALINYLSGIGYPGTKYQKLWPADLHMIGRDITWFHTVIWPAMLMSADLPLPKTVYSHGFLTVNGKKISKSLGNAIDPLYLAKTYGVDALRYTLLREVPAGEDGDFSEAKLIERNNTELADEIGNLLQRVLVMLHKYNNGAIPKPARFEKFDKELIDKTAIASEIDALMLKFTWHHALEKVMGLVHAINKYLTATEPWKEQDQSRRDTILYTATESLRIATLLLWPFLPTSAEKAAALLGQKITNLKKATFGRATKGTVSQPEILFKKIETTPAAPAAPAKDEAKPAAAEAAKDPFAQLDLRVARVQRVEPHPDADKLLVLQIDLGPLGQRQLVAGLKQWYTTEDLKGRLLVVVANLKPAMLRGKESRGMLLAAEKEGNVLTLTPKGDPGDRVIAEGIEPNPAAQVTIDQFAVVAKKFTTRNKQALYGAHALRTAQGPVEADIADGAQIR